MESEITPMTEAAQALRDLERHQLQVYTAAPSPRWVWPALGAAVGLFLASYAIPGTWPKIVAPAAYCLFIGIWAGTVNRRSGVWPRLQGMPRPLLRPLWHFWLGGLVAGIALVAIGVSVSFVVAGVLAAVVTSVGGTSFERGYRRRATELATAQSAR